ncbi:Rap1a/Tai family immunity protein [Telmatobacter sp. DSM 110680]|uniref:Rap1a/Tai family immunity protein n=1 Tax=Telmatobacter sp. DSM 110680 TaxID=3036704 RepID=A0AAU7DDK6_9BACT
MKCFAFVAVVVTLVVLPVHARAQVQTGADLLKNCQVVLERKPNNVAMLDGVSCLSYLRGMSETFSLWRVFNDRRNQKNPPPACVPNGVTAREIAIVVVKFIDRHPAEQHHAASDVALTALMDAYPCNETSR